MASDDGQGRMPGGGKGKKGAGSRRKDPDPGVPSEADMKPTGSPRQPGRAGASAVVVHNHGQIRQMSFPEGWDSELVEDNPGIGSRSFREVHRSDSPEAKLCFFYRGLPVSDRAAASFRTTLSRDPHKLDEDEIRLLAEILKTKTPVDSPGFSLDRAATGELNGRKVLVVQGTYPDISEQVENIYVDCDGTGKVVQEIYYQAPVPVYKRYLREVRQAMSTIQWTTPQVS